MDVYEKGSLTVSCSRYSGPARRSMEVKMMKKKYDAAELEIILFDVEDINTKSGDNETSLIPDQLEEPSTSPNNV